MEQQIELLRRLGKISKIKINEKDEKLQEDFEKIISYIDTIRGVDTTGIESLSYMQFMENTEKERMFADDVQSHANVLEWNVFREDEPVLENVQQNREDESVLENVLLDKEERVSENVPFNCFNRDELLKNAPKTEQGYFVVPKTVTE